MRKVDALNQYILCEATKFYEQTHQQNSVYAEDIARERSGTFLQRLLVRSQHLDSTEILKSDINQIHSTHKTILILLSILSFFFGYVLAQALLLNQNDSGVNVFVLLVALLSPNLFSLLMFFFLLIKKQGADAPFLGRVQKTTMTVFSAWRLKKSSSLQAWEGFYLKGSFSKWWFTTCAHGFWLFFLFGNLIGVVVRLSVHQYYFGWESTLLPDNFFISLTHGLSVPLTFFGFDLPVFDEIVSSHLSASAYATKSLAFKWAQFILASMMVFALLPRAVLLAISYAALTKSRKKITLDLRELDYTKLYKTLMLSESVSRVVDPDLEVRLLKPNFLKGSNRAGSITNENFKSLSVDVPLEKLSNILNAPHFLGAVIDRQTKAKISSSLKTQHNRDEPILILVSMMGLPSRGVLRSLAGFMKFSKTSYVNLIDTFEAKNELSDADFSQRLFDWHSALNELGVEENHIFSLEEHSQALLNINDPSKSSDP